MNCLQRCRKKQKNSETSDGASRAALLTQALAQAIAAPRFRPSLHQNRGRIWGRQSADGPRDGLAVLRTGNESPRGHFTNVISPAAMAILLVRQRLTMPTMTLIHDRDERKRQQVTVVRLLLHDRELLAPFDTNAIRRQLMKKFALGILLLCGMRHTTTSST